MDPTLNTKRLDKLARVRENQRKSRARKQDHIRELEQKLATLQKEAQQKDVEHRLTVQKLEAENKKLRYLLSSSGLTSKALEAYLRQVDNPVTAQKIAIPASKKCGAEPQPHQREPKSLQPSPPPGNQTSAETMRSSNTPEPPVTRMPDSSIINPAHQTQHLDSDQPNESASQSFCDCLPDEDMESSPIGGKVLNTTLCAIAEGLINQYNTRGVEIGEIQQKLRAGFSRGLTSEGCRVQNQILFQVLDEISND